MKNEKTGADSGAQFLSLISALLCLVSLVPVLPWRWRNIDANMGSRFNSARKFSLLTVDDSYGNMKVWFSMTSLICNKYQEMMQPSLMGTISGTLGTMVGSSAGGKSPGGVLAGCANWAICKTHVGQRCTSYTIIAIVGVLAFALIVIGIIYSLMVTSAVSGAASIKKKKDLQASKEAAMMKAGIAFACQAAGNLLFTFGTDSQIKALKRTSYYPYPHASFGMFVHTGGLVLAGIALLMAFLRQKKPAKEEEDDETTYEAAAGDQPQGAPAAPPGGSPWQPAPGPPPI